MNDRNKWYRTARPWLLKLLLLGWLLGGGLDLSAQLDEGELLAVVAEQNRDTVEVNALNFLYRLNRKTDPEKAVDFLEEGLALAEELDYQKGLANVWRSFGDYHNSRGDGEKALKALDTSMVLFEQLGDAEGVAACHNGLGNLAIRQGNYDVALEHYFSESHYYEDIGDERGIAVAYQNIGGVHYRQGQFEQAEDYIQKSLKMKEALGDSASLVPTLNALSVVLSAKKDYQRALAIQFRTLALSRRFSDPFQTANLINNIGVQYHYLNQLDSAQFYYQQALDIYKGIDEKQEMSLLYLNLGELQTLQGNGEAAIVYYDSSLAISTRIGGKEFEAHAYRGLSLAHEVEGEYQQALAWLVKHHALSDSLRGERMQSTINELEEKYQAEQKDKEIAELKKKEAEATVAENEKKVLLILIVAGAVLLVLGMLFWVTRNRAKEKQRRIELEQKALRSQMNPHFIFNSLGAIQSMYMSGETDLANNYLGDFGKLMRKILDNSGKETISIQEELEMLRLYLTLEKERSGGRIEYEFKVDERLDRMGTQIPPMVIQPFVENAIWHGILPSKRSGTIVIELKPGDAEGYLTCTIEDNGVGIRTSAGTQTHIPKGIDITEQRLGHKVQFTPLSPGTRALLRIPI